MDLIHRLSAFGSLCLLCGELARPSGGPSGIRVSGEYVYTTFQRQLERISGVTGLPEGIQDQADDTLHAVMIEVSSLRAPPLGLGTGTPAFELTGGVVVATAHTEADTPNPSGGSLINGSGNGRHETFWAVARVPIGERHSLEGGLEVPFNRSRDEIVYGPDHYLNPERRNLYVFTTNSALGYRHRGDSWEGSVALLYTTASTQNGTFYAYSNGSGAIWGGRIELLERFGLLGASLAAGYQGGDLTITEGLFPAFVERSFPERFERSFVQVELSHPLGRLLSRISGQWVDVRTPYWDSGAPLNAETAIHDGGLDFSSRSNEFLLAFGLDVPLRESFFLRFTALGRWGRETVDFHSTPVNPGSASLAVTRDGWAAGIGLRSIVP